MISNQSAKLFKLSSKFLQLILLTSTILVFLDINRIPTLDSSPSVLAKENRTLTIPISISSLNTGFVVVGEFEGNVDISSTSIDVTLTKSTIYSRDKASTIVAAIKVGIGEMLPDGNWNIKSDSQSINIDKTISSNEKYSLPETHFTIPMKNTSDLSSNWLIVELTIQTEGGTGTTYTHSERDIFKSKSKSNVLTNQNISSEVTNISPESTAWEKLVQERDLNSNTQKLNKFIDQYPDFTEAYIYRGQLYKENKDYDKSIQDFNRAIQLKPTPEKLTVVYYQMGLINSLFEKYEQAIDNYNQAISFYEKSSEWVHPISDIYNKLSSIYLLLGNQQEAINNGLKAVDYVHSIENYTELIKAKPDSEEAYFQRGELYLVRGNLNSINPVNRKEGINQQDINLQKSAEMFQKAFQDFKKVIQLNPAFPNAEYQLNLAEGLFYRQSDNLQEAVSAFSKAIQLNPKKFDAYYQRGLLFIKLKKYNLAFDDLTQAIKIKGYDKVVNPILSRDNTGNLILDEGYFATDVYFNRAISLLEQGDKRGALNDLSWIDAYAPDSVESFKLRARLRGEFGDKEGAERDLQQARLFYMLSINQTSDLSLDDPCSFKDKAFLNIRKGNLESALINISFSLHLRPDVTDFYLARIALNSELGDKQAIIDDYTQMIEYVSDHININDLIDIYQERGDLYSELGNTTKALDDYAIVERLTSSQLQKLHQALSGSSNRSIMSGWIDNSVPYEPIGRVCARHRGLEFAPATASEKEAKSRLATVYYKRGTIKSETNKTGAIQDLQKALVIFVELSDKTNEQKVRIALNSLK